MSSSLVESTQDSMLFDLCSHVQQRLALLLQRMFDQLDDVLFELADQSSNYAQQNLYFESMRDIRIKRRLIEQAFAQTIEGYFHTIVDHCAPYDLTQKQSALLASTDDNREIATLAFDSDDDRLMVDAMVAKALTQYPLPLAQLTARLDSLTPYKLESKQNPIGPYLVAQAFFFASRHLKISAKAKSIYFTAFDRCVLDSLSDVTILCNTILFEQGVLPHLTIDPTQHNASEPSYTQGASHQSGLSVEQLLKDSSDLSEASAAQIIQADSATKGTASDNSLAVVRPLGEGKILDRDIVVAVLCGIQQQKYQEWISMLNRESMETLPSINDVDIMQLIDRVLATEDANTYVSIDALDTELMNLVKMLFQFVIEDDNLSPAIKSLIACLYIPIIKVSLLDPSFFNQSGHPARQLLNEISTAALGWHPVPLEQRDPFAQEIIDIIHSILARFDKDVSIFQQSLDGFKTFLEIDSRNTSLLEQRLVDAEGGKAKSESTRHDIQQLIGRTLDSTPTPEVVERFLRSMWSNVLFVNRLKHGKDSVEFAHVLEVMDRLLWSVGPAKEFESRQALMSVLPSLLKDIREKLTEIDVNTLDQNHFFAELEAIHLNRIKSAAPKSEAHYSLETETETETELKNSDATPANIPQSENDQTQPEKTEKEPQIEQEEASFTDISEETLKQVNAIVVGGWVDFTEAGKRTRCRLAAKIKHTGMFLFVDRRGQKMAEYTADQLAHLVEQEQIHILDDGLLFDRALESVIGGLRR